MYLAEAVPPAAPVTVLAMAALFTLCALIVCIGIVKLVDAISRAFFGTIGGAVGWIPGAGGLLKQSLHKIEQKISHILGSAERKLDAGVAMTWNNCAHLVAWLGGELEGLARGSWHLAQQAKAFVRRREVTHEVRTAVKPVNARAHAAQVTARHARAETKALHHSVAQGVYPRIKANEAYDRTVAQPNIRTARAEARAAENQALATYKWLVKHRTGLLAGAFTGAVAWALTRVGGGWIRCKNWRAIGKRVCRIPWRTIEGLLSLALAFLVVVDPLVIAKSVVKIEDEFDGIIRDIANPSQAVTDATEAAMRVLETISSPLSEIFNP